MFGILYIITIKSKDHQNLLHTQGYRKNDSKEIMQFKWFTCGCPGKNLIDRDKSIWHKHKWSIFLKGAVRIMEYY